VRALTVVPGQPGSAVVRDVAEPDPADGAVLVETLAVGACGTDREIVDGRYGEAPAGEPWLVLGHEALGRVLEAPPGSGLATGDLVAGIVRRPDPEPCASCAVGEWDMCRNGRFTERGIKGRHGFASERFRIEPEFAVRVEPRLGRAGVLVEPASVVAKAWEHVTAIGRRAHFAPRRAVVTGAGPIGLLAALLGVQRGLEVEVLDRVTDGPKPELVRDLGARYAVGDPAEVCRDADIVLECTGVGQLVFEAMRCTPPGGIVCLTGISSGSRSIEVDLAHLNNALVLQNDVVFGSVNANRRHYELAAAALGAADRGWLERILTRRRPLERWREAFDKAPGDVKGVIEIGE
jgi:threonine dehydrogenase-like Zn-dependent dehydrogenase